MEEAFPTASLDLVLEFHNLDLGVESYSDSADSRQDYNPQLSTRNNRLAYAAPASQGAEGNTAAVAGLTAVSSASPSC